jgi:paraquat-inducible protein B
MSRRASPLLIGSFVVAGLALLAAVLIVVAGGELFERKERAVMYFRNSIYGLEKGAPVVFRGVRVGSVRSIGIFYDRNADNFAIPVVADLDPDAIRGLDGVRNGIESVLPTLLERGLSAQLSMQSLLTGQLYVDLDLRPRAERHLRGTRSGLTEIPTTTTAIQNLKSQFEGVDFRAMLDDLAALVKTAGAALKGPQLKQVLDDVAAATASLRRVAAAAEKRVDPMLAEARGAMTSTQRAMDKLGSAADDVSATADSLKGAGDSAKALLAPDSPLVRDLRATAEQLSLAAAGIRQTTSAEGSLARNTERALQDLSRAARSLRDLAELLERHPNALLRGRPPAPAASGAEPGAGVPR